MLALGNLATSRTELVREARNEFERQAKLTDIDLSANAQMDLVVVAAR